MYTKYNHKEQIMTTSDEHGKTNDRTVHGSRTCPSCNSLNTTSITSGMRYLIKRFLKIVWTFIWSLGYTLPVEETEEEQFQIKCDDCGYSWHDPWALHGPATKFVCPRCGETVSSQDVVCPHCGKQLTEVIVETEKDK